MSSSVRSFVEAASTALAIAAAVAVLWRSLGSGYGHRPQETVSAADGQIEAEMVRHVRGSGDLVLVEFSDFECPYCGVFARDIAPRLETAYIEPGGVKHVVFHFPLASHKHGVFAGEVAECAGMQGRFWEMRNELFRTDLSRALKDTSGLAERAALSVSDFDQCLKSGKARASVVRDIELGRRLGVDSTPSFFVGRMNAAGAIHLVKRIRGAARFELFDQTLVALVPNGTGLSQ